MTLVIDSSAVAAALVEAGARGSWSRELLGRAELMAPHHMLVEVASVLRRLVREGKTPDDQATRAHAGLIAVPFELFPYAPFASRIWELRANVTPYDAWYVALAEALDAPLATVDERLTRAPGPRCRFEIFPGST